MSTTVKEERTARSGSLMLPKRMMNGASNAGLGTMDGGVYGHMRSLKGHRVEDQQQQYDSDTGRRIAATNQPQTNIEEQQNNSRSINEKGGGMNGASKSPFVGDDRYLIDMIERDIIHRQLGVKFEGEYLSEGAAREWSTVVDISVPPPSFKPVSLYLSRSPLSKIPKQVFFNPINIFDIFYTLYYYFYNLLFRLTSK